MAKRKCKNSEEVGINDVRTLIRKELEKRYGSIANFLHHNDSAKFGGSKIRCYLYDSGSINFDKIAELSEWLGIGTLTRSVLVTRKYKYVLSRKQKGDEE